MSGSIHGYPACRVCRWRIALTFAAVVAGAFLLGYWSSDHRIDNKVSEAADVRIKEFVQFCDAIGVLDKAALTEAIITASEAEWEDRDDEQLEGGMK